MTRDYKSARGRHAGALSGTSGFLLGLALGLGIALAVFIYDRRLLSRPPEEPTAARSAAREPADEVAAEDPARQYDFYEMLPKFEVVVPEREQVKSRGARPEPIRDPGAYVLQAGSYRKHADADRVRAQLALQGIESQIQQVSIDEDTWHRVRIGPIADLAELNRLREKLKRAEVETIVLRVGE